MRKAPIPDWPGYWITDDGQVLSGYGRGWKRGMTLRDPPISRKLSPNHEGEPKVTLHIGNRRQTFKVSVLVARAFIGPCPSGKECSHVDGDPANNNWKNLLWETSKENNARKQEHGTLNIGARNGMAKLTSLQVDAIRALSAAGAKHCLIAQAVRISDAQVSVIVSRKSRKDA